MSTQPPTPPPPAPTPPAPDGPKKVRIKIGGKDVGTFLVPRSLDLPSVWVTYKKNHSMSDDPSKTWPRDFVNDLRQYHGCQDTKLSADSTVELLIR